MLLNFTWSHAVQTCLFYDIETTGLNKAFDQVLHFAAIRTDMNLKELARHEIKIKLNPDVIPAPAAILTHKMGVKEITEGTNEFEAIKQIHQWLNEPGTISLGYNTLGFDDEFLRFSFYRNLLSPYTHQFANQCSRMDIYPMTVMFFLFKKNILEWPQKNDKISLKLEDINVANQFISGRSHHAMIDVEITLELAKRFMQDRSMWDHLRSYFNKQSDLERMQPLQKEMALLIRPKLGTQAGYQCPVLFSGTHYHYKNQLLWLRLDDEKLMETTVDSIAETTFMMNKKPGEPDFILPLTKHQISPERLALAEKNKEWLKQNPDLFKKISAWHADHIWPTHPQTDVEAGLYRDGFWSAQETILCQRFHTASLQEKAKLAEQTISPRFQALALRILGKHYPEVLSAKQTAQFADHMRRTHSINPEDTLIDYRGNKRMTLITALDELAGLMETLEPNSSDQILLLELKNYFLHRQTMG